MLNFVALFFLLKMPSAIASVMMHSNAIQRSDFCFGLTGLEQLPGQQKTRSSNPVRYYLFHRSMTLLLIPAYKWKINLISELGKILLYEIIYSSTEETSNVW